MTDVLAELTAGRLLPVVVIYDAQCAPPLAEALKRGGLRCAEITLRTTAALAVPVFPGIATATELMAALDAGITTVKFFPAGQLGGLPTLTALAAPFGLARFIPTGGVTAANLAAYLGHPAVLAAGGSWMVAPGLIRAGNFDEIARLTVEATAIASGGQE